MPDFIPTAQEQLKFLKNIQLILQSGSFSSTYKFALLISLSRLAIEKGEDSGESLSLEYTEIAEKFIELYWKQAVPYIFNNQGQLILNQNNGKQAAIVKRIIEHRKNYSSLGVLRRDSCVWLALLNEVKIVVRKMPVTYLQNINGQNFEFLYQLDQCGKQLILPPKVMYCLRQFSEIIEELCQKRWIDYIRKNSSNAPILNQLPNLEQFMFEPSRSQLNAVANVLVELQACKCFYCNKPMRKGSYAVDHFIPWSMYPSDTGHNFVLADSSCNSKKSNLLASDEFLHKWQERNEEQDLIIVDRISVLGFLTDKERSHKVAEWAYRQANENNYVKWSVING
ncbi:HNH endonuclease domain-containing protein [Acinetobacter indicus]|uniref:HNH endonuclease domain-containing protein n=1 Tax=Acinetobacter indicus TaxID=756892 RepID=UPI000CEB834B|nr:HNH endonuclease domain-containing protein [Acinetobacter indicus]AVH14894.1 HNH endonuclease [Acinetobacter indicus]